MEEGYLVVFDPTPRKKVTGLGIANRPSDLKGKHLAVIWNGKLGGDTLLNRYSELLTERPGLAGVDRVDHRADTNTDLSQEEVDRLMALCEAAILGTAD